MPPKQNAGLRRNRGRRMAGRSKTGKGRRSLRIRARPGAKVRLRRNRSAGPRSQGRPGKLSAGPHPRQPKVPVPIVNSEQPLVSVIVPAMNERRTIAAVIANARQVHPDTEVIVVANGSADGTGEIARRMGARVIAFDRPLGHDVGRSIGARHARGNILLFTDGDIVIPASKLRPFAEAVRQGLDVALNRYNGRTLTKYPHSVVIAKHALNAIMHRRDLAGSSLTTIPHAVSRRMVEKVGAAALAVPPLALLAAVRHGLSVGRAAYVEVGRSNPARRRGHREDPLKRLIIGDHLEAVSRLLAEEGPRGGYTDLHRKRDKVR